LDNGGKDYADKLKAGIEEIESLEGVSAEQKADFVEMAGVSAQQGIMNKALEDGKITAAEQKNIDKAALEVKEQMTAYMEEHGQAAGGMKREGGARGIV